MEKEEEEEGAGDWTRSLHTQLKESSAQRHSLATCVLTFVFLSVVIYGSTDLKAKLAVPSQHQTPQLYCWMGEDCQKASGGPRVPPSCFHRHTHTRVATAALYWLTSQNNVRRNPRSQKSLCAVWDADSMLIVIILRQKSRIFPTLGIKWDFFFFLSEQVINLQLQNKSLKWWHIQLWEHPLFTSVKWTWSHMIMCRVVSASYVQPW